MKSEVKTCKKCVKLLPIDNFHRKSSAKDRLSPWCKVCKSEYDKNRDRKLYNQRSKLAREKWRLKNKDRIRSTYNKWRKHRREIDSNFKLRENIRNRIRIALMKGVKVLHSFDLVGCSIIELRNYLESKFTDGMSWANYGEWEIDHIIPCSSFNLVNLNEQKKCFHFTNMQPLWKTDNRRKSNSTDIFLSL
jgi:hypothetical protein